MQNILKNNQLRFFWSAIGAVAGSGLNFLSAHGANEKNMEIQRENMAMQRDINAQNIQLQKDMNAYNNPAAQLERLRAAGINPSFMSGDAVSPGNQTTVPSLTAPQNMMSATVPDLGSPIASGFANLGSERAQLAAATLSKESARKTIAETNAIELQYSLDRKYKEPRVKKELSLLDVEIAKGTEQYNQLVELVTSQQLDNAIKKIDKRYYECEKRYNIRQLRKNLRLTDKQIANVIQDTALELAQTKLTSAQEAYQVIINKLRKEYPMTFLSGQAGNGVSGLVGLLMDVAGFDPQKVKQFINQMVDANDPDLEPEFSWPWEKGRVRVESSPDGHQGATGRW